MANRDDNDDGKLQWMYKKAQVDKEEYLLGRAVDKAFEQGDASTPAVVKTERDPIPAPLIARASISEVEHVDLARKIHEDPLYAIKRKEIERREQLLKNPVKLKKLRDMLNKQRSKIEKEKLKSQKKKKKRKKSKEKSSDSDDDDIDSLLVEKYKKLKHKLNLNDISKLNDEDGSSDESLEESNGIEMSSKSTRDYNNCSHKNRYYDESRNKNYSRFDDKSYRNKSEGQYKEKRGYIKHGRSNERNDPDLSNDDIHSRMDKKKRLSKKKIAERSNSSESSESVESNDHERYRRKKKERRGNHEETNIHKSHGKSKIKDVENKHRDSSSDDSESNKHRRKSKKRRKKSNNHSTTDDDSDETEKHKSRRVEKDVKNSKKREESSAEFSKQKGKKQMPSESKTSSSSSSEDRDSDGQIIPKKKFGLVLPKGKISSSEIDRKVSDERVQVDKEKDKPKVFPKSKPIKLSEKEKEERRKEMLKNAEWRDDLRKKNIKSYKEKEVREKETQKEYSSEFYRNELSKAASQASIEGRIKSNINRIQRNASAMDSHFSKR